MPMTNPRDTGIYGHVIIPLVSKSSTMWNSHNGAHSNKRRESSKQTSLWDYWVVFKKIILDWPKRFIWVVLFFLPNPIHLDSCSGSISINTYIRDSSRDMSPSERNVFPFLHSEAQVAASTASKALSPGMVGRDLVHTPTPFFSQHMWMNSSDTLWNKRLLANPGKATISGIYEKKKKKKCFEFWMTDFKHTFGKTSPVWESGMAWRQNCLLKIHLEFQKQHYTLLERCSHSTAPLLGNSTSCSQRVKCISLTSV